MHQTPSADLSLAIALRLPTASLNRKPVVRWWFSDTENDLGFSDTAGG
jgi:hypothetical protein